MNRYKTKFQNWSYQQASKFQNFMIGRYGIDDFYKFLNTLTWIFIVLSLFMKKAYFSIITFGLIFYQYFRIFSKNYSKRYQENQRYLKISKPIKSFIQLQIRRVKERDQYRFRTCPQCKKVLRLPNKKGKHYVNCPNCTNMFEVKI